MGWLRIDPEMPRHQKYAPLSDAEFRLAVTAAAWCAEHMTDGFIPKNLIAALPRAPSSKKLASATKVLVDANIWHDRGDRFEIHDFLDWNMSRAQWETKVAAGASGGKAKASKSGGSNRQPTGQPPPGPPSKPLAHASQMLEHQPEQMPQQTASISHGTSYSICSSRSSILDLRSEDLEATTKDLKTSPRDDTSAVAVVIKTGPIRCPPDLHLTDDQRGALETCLIPGWAIDELTNQYVSAELADEAKVMPLVAWRKCLAKSISSCWNDQRRRPKRPDSTGPTIATAPPTGGEPGQAWHPGGYWYFPLPEQQAAV